MVKSLGLVSNQHLPATLATCRPRSMAPPREPSEGGCQGRDQALWGLGYPYSSEGSVRVFDGKAVEWGWGLKASGMAE